MGSSIILLGDSIFDNAAYVDGRPCVTEQLREIVPDEIDVTLLAVDGDYVTSVKTQVQGIPDQATHLFVSAGGNDALEHYETLMDDYLTSKDRFKKWSGIQSEFRSNYHEMLKDVKALHRHTAVCTIYDAVPGLEALAVTALSIFNDVIISEAVMSGLPIVDLRRVCTLPTDYADSSPIEPSCEGGAKIARALKRVFDEHSFDTTSSVVYC